MAKKKTGKKKAAKKAAPKKKAEKKTLQKEVEVMKQEPEMLQIDIPETVSQPAEPKPEKKGSMLKTAAIVVVAFTILAVAYVVFLMPRAQFVPGTPVDSETFLNNFQDEERVFIVMDVRGVQDQAISQNIYQCGVDFAGSVVMGSKNVSYISLGNEGCVTEKGAATYDECFSQLPQGITFYIKEGSTTSFYSNGVVVGVDQDYVMGQCGIKMS